MQVMMASEIASRAYLTEYSALENGNQKAEGWKVESNRSVPGLPSLHPDVIKKTETTVAPRHLSGRPPCRAGRLKITA